MMVTRLLLSFALPAALLGLIASPSLATMLPDRTVDDRTSEIAEIAQGLERGDVASNWNLSTRLEEMGPDIAPILEKALPAAGEKARLVFGKALIGLDRKAAGIRVMKDLVLAGKDLEVRRSAAKLIENLGDSTDHRALKKKLQSISDPYVKISLAKALARPPIWDRKALDILKDYLEFDDFSVRCEAAIALAEIDDFESGRTLLEQIRYEPSPRGRLANQLLEMELMLDAELRVAGLEKDDFVKKQSDEIKYLEMELKRLKNAGPGEPLINEIIDMIQEWHVKGDITREQLLDAAAHGMTSQFVPDPPLDQFSAYMNEKETKKFTENIKGHYAGIGAVVSMDKATKFLTIVKPIYSGPAYEAGIRKDDVILSVDGTSTFDQKVESMVNIIRGFPNTPVVLKVRRRGWREPQLITITREVVSLPVARATMLPGKIGYLHLLHFGEQAHGKMIELLETLENDGMETLILDLRGNPGGLLQQAVDVAGLFLNEKSDIVTSRGRHPATRVEEPHQGGGGKDARPGYDLIILVNGTSASASEIVSGALQDYGRATLIGETTYGKGSVQRPMPLKSKGGDAMLKLTVAEYFLPTGRSIHEKGVTPDITIEPLKLLDKIDNDEYGKLLEKKAFQNYIAEQYADNKELFARLAENDGGDTSLYPGFDAWYDSLETTIKRDEVRIILRYRIREQVEDEQGFEFPMNLQNDIQLQRAIAEALTLMDFDYRDFEPYSFFPEEFPEKRLEDGPAGDR
ncbi:MAG: S41 family peptidase [Planctomycetota bacterium]|nr:S41 family peptidase [Planctomycetota bacterium]